MRQLRNNHLARSLHDICELWHPGYISRVQVAALVLERVTDDVKTAVRQGLITRRRLHGDDVRLQYLKIVETAEGVLGALDGANPRGSGPDTGILCQFERVPKLLHRNAHLM